MSGTNQVIPEIWCEHTFTAQERADLESGKVITVSDYIISLTGKAHEPVKIRWNSRLNKIDADFGDENTE